MTRRFASMFLILASCVTLFVPRVPAGGEFPPKPRPVPVEWDDCRRSPPPDLERLIQQLKAERDELEGSRKPAGRRDPLDSARADQEHLQLQKQLKAVLERLQARPVRPVPEPTPLPVVEKAPASAEPKKKPEPNPADAKKSDEPAAKSSVETKSDKQEPVDHLALAQALFRAEMYDDALAAFRKVDLKGRRASERAPVQYLTACCLQRLGKSEDALPLLRDVANSRGDEQLAEYAQWQIGVIRWQQETRDLLQSVRQRRQAAEKKL